MCRGFKGITESLLFNNKAVQLPSKMATALIVAAAFKSLLR